MDAKHACGDNNNTEGVVDKTDLTINIISETDVVNEEPKKNGPCSEEKLTLNSIEEKDVKLKERIESCKKIIESLKLELTEEKAKLQEESRIANTHVMDSSLLNTSGKCAINMDSNKFSRDFHPDPSYLCRASVNNKLCCDESLMEYEKQLQKYQNTLNMAQAEKKNAIRKQMLAKAYRLKLLEVENQCNIELLRVKQSLQCLEPLQMIVKKWKSSGEEPDCNLNSYELIPRYPDVHPTSTSVVNVFTDDEKSELIATDDA